MEKRILNEFGSKILNEERIERVSRSLRSDHLTEFATMNFDCECDNNDCDETITISTEEYHHLHQKTKNFIVVTAHIQLDLEEITTSFGSYALVAKFFPRSGAV